MKKNLFSLVIVAIVLFASCTQKENSENYVPPYSKWTLGDDKYEGVRTFKLTDEKALYSISNLASSENVTLYFNSLPTESGVYAIKKFGFFSSPPQAGEVTILVSGYQHNFGSVVNDSLSAIVVYDKNGKLQVTIPQTKLIDMETSTDTILFKATLYENQ